MLLARSMSLVRYSARYSTVLHSTVDRSSAVSAQIEFGPKMKRNSPKISVRATRQGWVSNHPIFSPRSARSAEFHFSTKRKDAWLIKMGRGLSHVNGPINHFICLDTGAFPCGMVLCQGMRKLRSDFPLIVHQTRPTPETCSSSWPWQAAHGVSSVHLRFGPPLIWTADNDDIKPPKRKRGLPVRILTICESTLARRFER
ncbi:uncharacterized protein UTRI_00522 [Ustilago trichophora]|uniref:Uncharacterized protein n=1 Tax=Ustilago trichophora TaxID=86804 RepID=A0A5C3DRQ8_9BASI|nr:uncharacterized protein UTRI_00522 [Ustilago trichophora]